MNNTMNQITANSTSAEVMPMVNDPLLVKVRI